MQHHLLIIEEDNSFRNSLAQRLNMESFKVYTSARFQDIKRLIKRKPIDVVLLSLVELKEEGLEILSMVKHFVPSLEVILINASNAITLSIRGMKLGAYDDFLLPLDFKPLLDCIKEAAVRSRKRRKEKKTLLKRYEEMMLAITMAEAGSHDLAQDILKKGHSNRQSKKKKHPTSDKAGKKSN